MTKDSDKTKEQLSSELNDLRNKSKEREEKYNILSDNMTIGLVLHNANTEIIFSNPAAKKILGLTKEQMNGKKAIDPAWNFCRRDGSILALEEYPVNKVIATNKPIKEYIIGLKVPDRDFISWFSVNASPVFDNKKDLNYVTITFSDITERIQAEAKQKTTNQQLVAANQQLLASEQQLQANNQQLQATEQQLRATNQELQASEVKFKSLYDNAPLSYQSLTEEGNFREINKTWLNTLGYTKEEVIGKKYADFVHPDWKSHFEKNFPAFKKRGYVHDVQYKIRHKDGHYLYISFEGCIGYYPDGSFKQTYCVFKDITDLKKAEEEKEKLESQLRQSQKMEAIGQLAGGVAHDFNNMLAGIMGAADLLKMKKRNMDEKSLELVDLVIKSAEQAASLTAKLLAFSRKSKISTSSVNIHDIIDDALSILKNTIDKRIEITAEKEAKNNTVIGDNHALQNALMNITINASHAITQGGKIQIRTSNINFDVAYCNSSPLKILPGEYIEIMVKDTGKGIEPENIGKIFEPFFTTKEKGKGTGLGLAAVYGTVQEHNGFITADSEIDIGTTFHLYLPCSEKRIESTDHKTDILTGSGNILLVDDEDIIRSTGKFMLEDMGYTVTVAKNGLEALKIFKLKYAEIDIVIMDMIMPIMNGREAFLKMKEIDQNCQVLIASGFTKDENITELTKEGLTGFIQKPFRNFKISELLANIMKN